MGPGMKLGHTIREARESRAWTQEKLAEIAGISTRTVQRIEAIDKATFETIRRIASALELDVDKLTGTARTKSEQNIGSVILHLISTGAGMTNLIASADAFLPQYEEPTDRTESQLIGYFLDFVQDWGECWDDLAPSQRTDLTFEFKELLDKLASSGLKVFGNRVAMKYCKLNKKVALITAVVMVVRSTSLLINRLGDGNEVVATLINS